MKAKTVHILYGENAIALPGIQITAAEFTTQSAGYGQGKKFSTAELWNIQRRKKAVVIR